MVKWRPKDSADSIIAVDIKGNIRRYSNKDQKEIACIEPEEVDNRLFGLDYSPDGETFAAGGSDHFVRVYNIVFKLSNLIIYIGI